MEYKRGLRVRLNLVRDPVDNYIEHKDEIEEVLKPFTVVPRNKISKVDTDQWLYVSSAWQDKNYVKAVECYRKSAEKGDVYAQYALAECYFEGKGIDVDIDKAACWYKKAAVQGFKDAETKLKQMGF